MSVIIDLNGLSIQKKEQPLLTHPNTSGVILFARNIENRAQLSSLIQEILEINPKLILMIDHEGGYVQRIQRLQFRALPAARVYGELYDMNQAIACEAARKYGRIMADDLLNLGIHVGLAPILDVHGDNKIIAGLDRAFHQSPNAIIALATAFIDGMHDAGMPSVGKHFPGHGSCTDDSHISMPVDARSFAEIESHDLKPFKSLIASKHLDAIMPAHITYPSIDPDFAAGYSSIWLQEILRDKLGFDGLIISDCLGMTGADIGDLLTRGTRALDAGCNMLIAANQKREVLSAFLDTLPSQYQAINAPYIHRFQQQIKQRGITKNAECHEATPSSIDKDKNPTETI